MSEPVKRRRVLVVDDEALLRSAIRRNLQASCDVFLAATPEEALGILTTQECDVVISDVSIPPSMMHGPEFLRQVQALYPNVIRLIMSGNDGEEAQEAVTAGVAEAFLAKPLNLDELEALLARVRARLASS